MISAESGALRASAGSPDTPEPQVRNLSATTTLISIHSHLPHIDRILTSNRDISRTNDNNRFFSLITTSWSSAAQPKAATTPDHFPEMALAMTPVAMPTTQDDIMDIDIDMDVDDTMPIAGEDEILEV